MTTTDPYWLSRGAHATAAEGRCAMEWVSHLAGEEHSEVPRCVSKVLARFCPAMNDRLDDEDRQLLRPYLARTIGTRDDGRDVIRARMCIEFLIETALPVMLRHDRDALRNLQELPPISSVPLGLGVGRVCEMATEIAVVAWDNSSARTWHRESAGVKALAREAGASAYAAGVAGCMYAPASATTADLAEDALLAAVRVWPVAEGFRWLRDVHATLTPLAFDLLDRMLPTVPLELPARDTAKVVQ